MPLTLTDLDFDTSLLPPREHDRFLADVNALRDHRLHHDLLQLRLGDAFNEMKARWGEKMPALARQAGVSYHAARQRARVAHAFPPHSPLRSLGLPYSILRLLAPLPDPEFWANHALLLQKAKLLRVRSFARILEDDGARKRRTPAPPPPRCAQCDRELPEHDAFRLSFAFGETKGWLCDSRCATAYLYQRQSPLPADPRPSTLDPQPSPPRPSDRPVGAPQNCESQSPPDPPITAASPPAPGAARNRESQRKPYWRYKPIARNLPRSRARGRWKPRTARNSPHAWRAGRTPWTAGLRPRPRRPPPRRRPKPTRRRTRDPPLLRTP